MDWKLSTLVNEEMKPGNYEVVWGPVGLASGVYFYRLSARTTSGQAGTFVQTRKMLLLR